MRGKLDQDEDAKIQVFVKGGAQSKNNLESDWINCLCITDISLPGEAGSYRRRLADGVESVTRCRHWPVAKLQCCILFN